MPEVMTLLDIAKMNGTDGLAGLIDETIVAAPEVQAISARTIKGTNYKTLIRTALPTVGFRAANQGAARSKSTYINKMFECFIFNPKWSVDKAIATSSEDGPEAVIALEADAIMKAAFVALGKQFYYGANGGGDTLGHPGLLQMYDPATMLIDATGSTVDAASSVWAVKHGESDVQWLWGGDGDFGLSDVAEVELTDDDGNMYTALMQQILSHVGLKMGSTRCVGRIKNLTTQAGKGLTDDLIYDLLALFPAGQKPDALFMSRRSLGQLRKSRTATNATGAAAPIPTEVEGIPIKVTDSILDTEAINS